MVEECLNIRAYHDGDFERLARLHLETEKIERTVSYPSPRSLQEQLEYPGAFPAQNLFIAETKGTAVGYIKLSPEPAVGRVILNGLVHPAYRRRGVASRLLQYCLQRAAQMEAAVAHVNITRGNQVAKLFLSAKGFYLIRRFLELRIDLSRTPRCKSNKAGLHFRPLAKDEVPLLTRLQNRCFSGSWGFNPNTEQQICYQLGLHESCAGDVILAVTAAGNTVAYCWARPARQQQKGRILMLGVDPDYRGLGIGREVLQAGLASLRAGGIRVVELTVDSMNRAACSLYFSAGFKIWNSSEWYEKKVPDVNCAFPRTAL